MGVARPRSGKVQLRFGRGPADTVQKKGAGDETRAGTAAVLPSGHVPHAAADEVAVGRRASLAEGSGKAGLAVIEDLSWMDRRKCRNVPREVFYPDNSAGVARARRICAHCAVRSPCLEYALRHHIADGIWGGTSERERLRLQRERRSRSHHDGRLPR